MGRWKQVSVGGWVGEQLQWVEVSKESGLVQGLCRVEGLQMGGHGWVWWSKVGGIVSGECGSVKAKEVEVN